MVQLPAFPRDLKRRSRTSPWCRIVRRCPGCTDSSKEPSVQPFGRRSRVPKYPICHICRYHGAHWSHPGWLGPPTLHTCDSHRVSNFWIFLEGNGCRSFFLAGALGDPGDCHPCHSGGTACGQASCRPVAEWEGLARAALAGAAWWAANQDGISNQERTGKKCGEDTTCNLWYVKADDFRSIWVCSQPFHLRALPLSRTSPWRSIRNRCHDGNGGTLLRFYLAFLAHPKKAWEGFLLFSSQICTGMITQSQVTGVLDPHWHQRKACWQMTCEPPCLKHQVTCLYNRANYIWCLWESVILQAKTPIRMIDRQIDR